MIDEDLTFFDVEDTASLLGVHPETVRRWCRAGSSLISKPGGGASCEYRHLP